MQKILFISAVFTLLSSTVHAETIKASVNGLVCAFCATGIEKTFKAQPDVESVHVDLDSKLVTITTKPDKKIDDDTVTRLITDAGYSVTNISREE